MSGRVGRAGASGGHPALRRLLAAALLIAACVGACVAVPAVLDGPHAGAVEKLRLALTFGDAGSASVPGTDEQLPEGFQEEVLSLEGRKDVRVGAGGQVVGFVERADPQEAFAALSAELEAGGWAAIDSGRDDCGSFVKGGGRFAWVFVSCVRVGEATSVVVSTVAAG